MGLTPDIMQHITGVSADSVQTLDYDFLSGNLIINAADFQANGGTLDRVYKASKAYIEGSHNTYSDLSTTRDENHPYIAVINGEIYFFNPNESSEELNDAVRDLAATGAASIKEVASTDNYIFEKDGKYYSYSPVLLPKWVYTNPTGCQAPRAALRAPSKLERRLRHLAFENLNLNHTLRILSFRFILFAAGEISNTYIILVFLKNVSEHMTRDFTVKIKLFDELQCTEKIAFFICIDLTHFQAPPQRCDLSNRTLEGFFQIE